MPLMYKNPRSHANLLSPLSNPKTPASPPLLTPPGHEFHPNTPPTTSPSTMFSPLRRIMVAASSSLRTHRGRCLFLLFCSPILLPFLCATFPLLCAAELFIRICRRSRRKVEADDDEQRLRRCEEGYSDCDRLVEEGKEIGLLQRYLEDQLSLVGSVYGCGDEFDSQDEQDNANQTLDFKTPLLG